MINTSKPSGKPGQAPVRLLLLLTHDLDVTIINATTGQLLRELTIDPTRDYQPLNTKKPPNPQVQGFPMS